MAIRLFVSLPAAILLASPLTAADESGVRTVLAKHCVACHGPAVQKGEFRIDKLTAQFADAEVRGQWKGVLDRVADGSMPPPAKPRLSQAELDTVKSWVSRELAEVDRVRQKKEGRVLLRRLNSTEYENTIRDLLGVRVNVKELLPSDPVSHGFDNLAGELKVSEVQLRRYLEAADLALNAAIVHVPRPEPLKQSFSYADKAFARNFEKNWHKLADGTPVLPNDGNFPSTVLSPFRASGPGKYTIRVKGFGHNTPGSVSFIVYTGTFGRAPETNLEGTFELPAEKPGVVELTGWMETGDTIKISPQNLRRAGPKVDASKQPGLAVVGIEIDGPHVETWPPRGHKLLFGDLPIKTSPAPKGPKRGKATGEVVSTNPDSDAKRLLPGFLSAAFRRPVTLEETAPFLGVFTEERKAGASFEAAMKSAAAAALCSPQFLYLRESPGKLDDFALAARLSYFLTRTAPDDELLKLASAQKLSDPAVLRAQTERLLKHPNAHRFSADFTDAWLDLRNIEFTNPDRLLYPEFDASLKLAMVQETRLFFDEILANNLPASTFLDSDFTILNERLAKHYGVPGVKGTEFRRVALPKDSPRGGILTQASVLKVSANGTNTSPVVRGVYVLERILGITPPPPPAIGVAAVEPDIRGAKTIRELLDKHRSTEQCAGCHRQIDPPGFALEEFDVIGGHRSNFRTLGAAGKPVPGSRFKMGPKVDSSGELLGGKRFQNFAEFQKLLLSDPDRFATCLTEKLIAFSTGRLVGPADRSEVEKIVRESATRKHAFRDLVHAVVQSELFRTK